jgi:hypothetical protein
LPGASLSSPRLEGAGMVCRVKPGLDRDQNVAFSGFVIVSQQNCALRQFDRDAVLDKL